MACEELCHDHVLLSGNELYRPGPVESKGCYGYGFILWAKQVRSSFRHQDRSGTDENPRILPKGQRTGRLFIPYKLRWEHQTFPEVQVPEKENERKIKNHCQGRRDRRRFYHLLHKAFLGHDSQISRNIHRNNQRGTRSPFPEDH